ncbi:DUF6188 family protein [Kitasatospora sp. NPDC048365]|uniref:DUF6188 family protein n=1 Tax=Kitasatospora sp. NPDC048365 TaxID=3364050 RepID=UPI003723BAC3
MALDDARTPGQGQPAGDRGKVSAQAADEGVGAGHAEAFGHRGDVQIHCVLDEGGEGVDGVVPASPGRQGQHDGPGACGPTARWAARLWSLLGWCRRCSAVHRAVVSESMPAEHEDRWIMNLRGLAVTEISAGYQLVLRLDSDARVVLGCPFKLTHGVGDGRQDVLLGPGRQDVAAVSGLFGAKVLSAVAFKTGSLRLVFDNGRHLNSRADPSFEAWEVLGSGGWRVVSMPGGKLAVWSDRGRPDA